MSFDWKSTVKTIAPLIGTALGGPMGGAAAKVLTSALGLEENAEESQIAEAIRTASPETLLSLKNADNDFKLQMKELGIKEEQLYVEDRDSARKRDVALGGDTIVKALAVITALCFFSMIGWLLWKGVPETIDKTILGMLIGYMVGLAQQVYNFYFGSSKGSQDKTSHLANAVTK